MQRTLEKAHFTMRPPTAVALLAPLLLALLVAQPALGQGASELVRADALERHHPQLYDLVDRLELANSVLFAALAREHDADRALSPPSDFESALVDQLTGLVRGDRIDAEGEEAPRYEVLGPRAAHLILRGQAFQREVLSILADPDVGDQRVALADAVSRYRSQPDAALPTVPKNMDVLYGHAYALDFRTKFADLDGLVWAGHWLRLAATEPLTDLAHGSERVAGIDTVTRRYHAKLSYGEPPQAFPSELPLAPAIAPGLIWLSPESATIWDNLSMLLEVLADVLAAPEMPDVPAATEATINFFLDPDLGVTNQDEWEIMALRHGIFFQGGFPLAVMTQNERNVGGHAAHLQGGGMLRMIPGMPRN